jgi:hypothetical protein
MVGGLSKSSSGSPANPSTSFRLRLSDYDGQAGQVAGLEGDHAQGMTALQKDRRDLLRGHHGKLEKTV